jgi:hypothetical protein
VQQIVNLLLALRFLWTKGRTGGSRPARRHPFCPGGHKKDAKKALLLAEGISFASFHSLQDNAEIKNPALSLRAFRIVPLL